jgi:hypothetical protein
MFTTSDIDRMLGIAPQKPSGAPTRSFRLADVGKPSLSLAEKRQRQRNSFRTRMRRELRQGLTPASSILAQS